MKIKNKPTGILVLFSMVLVLSIVSPVLAHSGEDDYDHHGMMDGFYGGMMGGFGMGFFGWIIIILLVVILVLFIIWIVRQLQEPHKKRRR